MLLHKRRVFVVLILLCLCCIGVTLLLCCRFSDMHINTIIDGMAASRARTHISVKDGETLAELDDLLKTNTDVYKGFIYSSNVLYADISYGNKTIAAPVLLVSRTMLEQAPFFRLKKGNSFDFAEGSNSVILTGDRFQGVKIDKAMSITLHSEDGMNARTLSAQVSGKADKLYALPEYSKNSAEDFLRYARNLILLPDDGSYDDLFIQRQKTAILLTRSMTASQYTQFSQLIDETQGVALLPTNGVSYIRYFYLSTLIAITAISAIFFIAAHYFIDSILQRFELPLRHELVSLIISAAIALLVFLITILINAFEVWRSVRSGYALIVYAAAQLPLLIKNTVSFINHKNQEKNKKVLRYEKI